jgi:phage baseplate assembly protein W
MAIEKRYYPIDLLPDVAVGIKLPLSKQDGRLFDLSYTTEEQAISNLKNLILTRQGERLMQPLFGTRLQDTLFEPNTELIRDALRESIISAVQFWLPYITIQRLDVESVISVLGNIEEHGVKVTLIVNVNNQEANIPVTFLVTQTTVEIL